MLKYEVGPVGWVASSVLPWLDDGTRDVAQLLRWLSGYDLPPVGQDEEPYLWLLRALPRGATRPKFESALTASTAKLLQRVAEFRWIADGERLLYNLLNLSAGLRGRDELAAPLLDVLKKDLLHGLAYDGLSLDSVLLTALIYNQQDETLQPVWEAMAQGTPHPILGGSPLDAFHGTVYMPPCVGSEGRPAVYAIGFALTSLIRFLGDQPENVIPLRAYIERLQSRYPGHDWALELIRFSDRYGWPRWTDVALPDLAVSLGDGRYLVWCRTGQLLVEQFDIEQVAVCLNGRAWEVIVSDSRIGTYQKIAMTAEKYRRSATFGGEHAESGIVSTTWQVLQQFFGREELHKAEAAAKEAGRKNTESVFATC